MERTQRFGVVLATCFVAMISVRWTMGTEKTVEYCNPISPWSADAWEDYGFGDPFVFRYNGRYYLYPSTRDDSIGVKCWSSFNLVDWSYEGFCCVDPTTKGAYAPEVYRGADAFYMTTSPGGKGHYIYRSLSPTGPFERVTDNFGCTIDGSVFIDDDGRGYFYSASDFGILARRMDSPTRVDPQSKSIGSFMNGWTEGPSVFKEGDVYFTTYTGNHVFSKGYRINAGSGDSPTSMKPMKSNPVLISTSEDLSGLGHNSVVKGPNLDLYYIVYHSLAGRSKRAGWPLRETHIDRLVLDGETLSVAGPTRTKQKILTPDVAVWFRSKSDLKAFRRVGGRTDLTTRAIRDGAIELEPGDAIALCEEFGDEFTAEFNISFTRDAGRAGFFFCRKDKVNYGKLTIDASRKRAEIVFCVEGKKRVEEYELPRLFDAPLSFTTFRAFQIERDGSRFLFFVDDRKFAESSSDLGDGTLGYFSEDAVARCGFIGATRATQGRSAQVLASPIPGRVSLSHLDTEGDAFRVEVVDREKRASALQMSQGASAVARVDASEGGEYLVVARYSASRSATLDVAINGVALAPCELTRTRDDETPEFRSVVVGRARLKLGKGRATATCREGTCLLKELEFVACSSKNRKSDFRVDLDLPTYSDGAWTIDEGAFSSDGDFFGKRLYGDYRWSDYRVEADVSFPEQGRYAGLVVRASAPTLGGPGNSARLGVDFLFGYYVSIENGTLALGKVSYGYEGLTSVPCDVKPGDFARLQIELIGSRIVVLLNGVKQIDYIDNDPILTGCAGARSCGGAIGIKNFRVAPIVAGR